ncbi:2-oxo-4-hydroxy-4-carboxy-5-ureidoimidazoline decarboxylase [Rhodococcus erythropolis]|uniref:2-oxo-4-hydroxy-4-carboxy-5-ureidoimidazoline decarboxylase n=1 Tax=Rhodococcus erythropolis TaxID=1833 RepID=UPI001E64F909|nr:MULTISPECIES: 2-oxo-4-hydroxy-4-carboxy-5-ureidoimidazoline decarboxylase [Rhodococcus erythropolis group]MCD2103883.1 2-oxo-4-hydroxy-4-carboxy-5-ureidoimidazoline decarboxylase [Rhodococcus qingshengii]MCZ4522936.1 2-oxo-4-hydroxy-4-carboxy-5-ureidoimidazoline decarboxylase [Rhodococcus erythropolis]
MPTTNSSGLGAFDALGDHQAVAALLECCHSAMWAEQIAGSRPFADLKALFDTADAVLAKLPESEIDDALSGHPRIGERTESASSIREQSGVSSATEDIFAELRQKNAEYEDKFGHVYLVCASGKSGTELLDILRGRLRNDPATERSVLRTELAAINRIRLARLIDSLAGGAA